MSGAIILGAGIGMIFFSAILLMIRIVYSKTAGRRISEELKEEYE